MDGGRQEGGGPGGMTNEDQADGIMGAPNGGASDADSPHKGGGGWGAGFIHLTKRAYLLRNVFICLELLFLNVSALMYSCFCFDLLLILTIFGKMILIEHLLSFSFLKGCFVYV